MVNQIFNVVIEPILHFPQLVPKVIQQGRGHGGMGERVKEMGEEKNIENKVCFIATVGVSGNVGLVGWVLVLFIHIYTTMI